MTVVLTQTGVGRSTVHVPDTFLDPFNIGLGCVVVSGSATYTVEHTFENVLSPGFDAENAVWFANSGLTNKTENAQGNYAYAVNGISLNVTGGTGTVALYIVQAGTGQTVIEAAEAPPVSGAPWSFDPAHINADMILSGGNLVASAIEDISQIYPANALGTYEIASPDKVMFSLTFTGDPTIRLPGVGLANQSWGNSNLYLEEGTISIGIYFDGNLSWDYANIATVPPFPLSGSTVDVCFDAATMNFWSRTDGGDWNGDPLADPAANAGGIVLPGPSLPVYPAVLIDAAIPIVPFSWTINAISAYGVPSGFKFLYGEAV